MLDENDIKEIIINSLYDKNIITKELHEKCGKPKVISDLPHDLRTNDVDKLNERKDAINDKIQSIENDIKEYESVLSEETKEFNNDIERLGRKFFYANEWPHSGGSRLPYDFGRMSGNKSDEEYYDWRNVFWDELGESPNPLDFTPEQSKRLIKVANNIRNYTNSHNLDYNVMDTVNPKKEFDWFCDNLIRVAESYPSDNLKKLNSNFMSQNKDLEYLRDELKLIDDKINENS